MTLLKDLFNIKVIVIQSNLNVYLTMKIIISTLIRGSVKICMLCWFSSDIKNKNITPSNIKNFIKYLINTKIPILNIL